MTFKKQIITLLVVIGCHFNVSTAQAIFQLGFGLGVNTWRTTLKDDQGVAYYQSENIGGQVGLVGRFHPLFIYVQPAAFFLFDRFSVTKNSEELEKMWVQRWKIVLPLGCSLLGLLRIHVGLAMSGPFVSHENDDCFNIKTYYQRVQYSYLIGGGFDIKNLMIDINFESELKKAHPKITVGEQDYRPKYLGIQVSYNLL